MAFQIMSNIGQGFAMELEQQARRMVEGEEIVGEELEQLYTVLTYWIEEVRRLQDKARAKNEAAHQAHHDRADIHEQVSTQLHVNLGQPSEEMRIRDEKLKAELIKTRNEFAAYTAKTKKEHLETREVVVRIYRQRKVDGEEWGKYMAQAKERDLLLTKKIAEMEEELGKARIIPTETAGTNIGESLMEERVYTLPSEGGSRNGRGPPRPPNVAGAPNPGDNDCHDESYYRAPNRPRNDPRRPARHQDQGPNPTEAERISDILARTMARGSRRAAQPPFKFENKPSQDVRV